MAQIVRALLATVSLLVLWFLAFALQELSVPVWALGVIGALSVVNLIVLMGLFHQLTCERDRREGGNGRAVAPNPVAPNPGGGGEPSWWPKFERELAQYSAEHERGDRSAARVPVGTV
jgi:hypothetical protein